MINKVQLIGRVGKDPEIKTFDSGNKAAAFSLATSEKFKNKQGENVENTEWHNIVIYGKIADIVEKYIFKGQLLFCEGKIRTRSWDDSSGNKKYMTEIVCYEIKMLGRNEQTSSNIQQNTQQTNDNAVDFPDLLF